MNRVLSYAQDRVVHLKRVQFLLPKLLSLKMPHLVFYIAVTGLALALFCLFVRKACFFFIYSEMQLNFCMGQTRQDIYFSKNSSLVLCTCMNA